jgi:hypothetical protein
MPASGIGNRVIAGFGESQFAGGQIFFRYSLFSEECPDGQRCRPNLREIAPERKLQRLAPG